MKTIEDIILQNDQRGVSYLRPFLPADFCTETAKYILSHSGTTIITTGFYILYGKSVETDGPPGALAIGHALQSLGKKVVYVTDKYCMPIIQGLGVHPSNTVEFPITDKEQSIKFSEQLLEEINPALLLSIERCSPSSDGIYRNMKSMDVSDYTAKIDTMFGYRPSVGIGDGGNEIGMGLLHEQILKYPELHPKPAYTACDRLVIASCSNWGAWGLIAALSNLTETNLLPTIEEETDRIDKCVELGVVDGFTGEVKPYVDGFPLKEYLSPLEQLHELIV